MKRFIVLLIAIFVAGVQRVDAAAPQPNQNPTVEELLQHLGQEFAQAGPNTAPLRNDQIDNLLHDLAQQVQPVGGNGQQNAGRIHLRRSLNRNLRDLDQQPEEQEAFVRSLFGINDDAQPQDNSLWTRFLGWEYAVSLGNTSGQIDVNAVDVDPLLLYRWDVRVGTYDLLKALCLCLDLWVEQYLFEQCTKHFNGLVISNFNSKRDAIVKLYKECESLDPQDRDRQVMQAFNSQFALVPKISLATCKAVGLSLILHYIFEACEETIVPSQDANKALVNAVRFLDQIDRADRDRQAGNRINIQPIIMPIRPVATFIRLIRNHYLGYSILEQNVRSFREFALSSVQGLYPEDHWYHKLLKGVNFITDLELFVISKKMFMWYRCIYHMQDHYNTLLSTCIEHNTPTILANIAVLAQEPKGSQYAKEADEKIKALLQNIPQDGALSWARLKNTSMNKTSLMVEGVLLIPVAIEVVKLVIRFAPVIANMVQRRP